MESWFRVRDRFGITTSTKYFKAHEDGKLPKGFPSDPNKWYGLRWARLLGKKPHVTWKKRPEIIARIHKEVARRHKTGKTLRDIATELKVPRTTVYYISGGVHWSCRTA